MSRTFTVIAPGQSIGVPGTVVTAEELDMDDDQLDEWVEHGYGAEAGLSEPTGSAPVADWPAEQPVDPAPPTL